jgi:hypothetical protein
MERSEFSGDTAFSGQTRSGMLDAHPGQNVLLSFILKEATGLYHK